MLAGGRGGLSASGRAPGSVSEETALRISGSSSLSTLGSSSAPFPPDEKVGPASPGEAMAARSDEATPPLEPRRDHYGAAAVNVLLTIPPPSHPLHLASTSVSS